LFGRLGTLAGFWGSKDVIITCINCAHSWEAGEVKAQKQPIPPVPPISLTNVSSSPQSFPENVSASPQSLAEGEKYYFVPKKIQDLIKKESEARYAFNDASQTIGCLLMYYPFVPLGIAIFLRLFYKISFYPALGFSYLGFGLIILPFAINYLKKRKKYFECQKYFPY
jgi:hypothetical protein